VGYETIPQHRPMLFRSVLEELLDHVITEHVHHQIQRMGEDFREDLRMNEFLLERKRKKKKKKTKKKEKKKKKKKEKKKRKKKRRKRKRKKNTHLILLFVGGGLELLLDESAAVLIPAEFHDVSHDILQFVFLVLVVSEIFQQRAANYGALTTAAAPPTGA